MKLIDVSKLNEATIIYDKALRALPYATLQQVAATLKLNVMDLQGKHSRINERRRAGGTQSYKIGKEFKEFEQIFGYEPSLIEPKDVVFITKENSQKYDDNELLIIGGQPVSNITKKHPMETKIVFGLTTSHAEDIVYYLFHAERDEDSKSPSGAMDGYFTKADKLIISGAVNAAGVTLPFRENSPHRSMKMITVRMRTWLTGLAVRTIRCVVHRAVTRN